MGGAKGGMSGMGMGMGQMMRPMSPAMTYRGKSGGNGFMNRRGAIMMGGMSPMMSGMGGMGGMGGSMMGKGKPRS